MKTNYPTFPGYRWSASAYLPRRGGKWDSGKEIHSLKYLPLPAQVLGGVYFISWVIIEVCVCVFVHTHAMRGELQFREYLIPLLSSGYS